jgi:multiple sugar transport system substrate-binding protein
MLKATAGLSVGLVAAVRGPKAVRAQSGKVSIRYANFQLAEEPTGTALRAFIADFEKANPNIKVELDPSPYAQYVTKIVTQSEAKQGPDALLVNDAWLYGWAERGYLEPVESFISKPGGDDYKKDFNPVNLKTGTYKGELYILPQFTGAMLLHYNKELFRSAGLDPEKPPTNWTEMLDYCGKLTKKDASGKEVQWGYAVTGSKETGSIIRFTHWIYNNGGAVLTPNNDASALDSKEAIGALRYWSELYTAHRVVPPGPTEVGAVAMRGLFAQQRVAMYQDLVWGLNLIANQNAEMKDKHAVAIFPTQIGQDRAPSFLTFQGVTRYSKHKEEAWRLIDFICAKEQQVRLYKAGRFTPARLSALGSPDVQGDPAAKVAGEAAKTMMPQPPIPRWNEIVPVVGDAAQQALTKARTPEEAFRAAHQRINALLRR